MSKSPDPELLKAVLGTFMEEAQRRGLQIVRDPAHRTALMATLGAFFPLAHERGQLEPLVESMGGDVTIIPPDDDLADLIGAPDASDFAEDFDCIAEQAAMMWDDFVKDDPTTVALVVEFNKDMENDGTKLNDAALDRLKSLGLIADAEDEDSPYNVTALGDVILNHMFDPDEEDGEDPEDSDDDLPSDEEPDDSD